MKQNKLVMNVGNMIGWTVRAKSRTDGWLKLADDVANDTRKAERLNRHECKACFYGGRIGGAAMTTRACMSCGEDQLYGSTSTDALCLPCATKHTLCKRCGGDLEMRTRRKDWPVVPNAELCGARRASEPTPGYAGDNNGE